MVLNRKPLIIFRDFNQKLFSLTRFISRWKKLKRQIIDTFIKCAL